MKGQLGFDEYMKLSEEKPWQETRAGVGVRVPMVDPCYYCLCNSCINNAESTTVNSCEVPDDWKPCFFCDDCRNYDGDTAKKIWKENSVIGMKLTIIMRNKTGRNSECSSDLQDIPQVKRGEL